MDKTKTRLRRHFFWYSTSVLLAFFGLAFLGKYRDIDTGLSPTPSAFLTSTHNLYLIQMLTVAFACYLAFIYINGGMRNLSFIPVPGFMKWNDQHLRQNQIPGGGSMGADPDARLSGVIYGLKNRL